MHAKIIFFGLTFNALLLGWVFFLKILFLFFYAIYENWHMLYSWEEPICICTLISILKYTRNITQQPYDNLLPNTIVIGWINRFGSLNPALYPCKQCLVTWRRCMSKRFLQNLLTVYQYKRRGPKYQIIIYIFFRNLFIFMCIGIFFNGEKW